MRTELRAQTAIENIAVLPWSNVQDLPGLWLIPLGLILQDGRHLWLIYYYIWNNLSVAVLHQAPAEAMQFFQMLPRLLCTTFNSDPREGPIYMSNIDLADTYTRVWIRPEDLLWITFFPPLHTSYDNILISFHLSLPMGYVYSSLYFF